MFFLNNKLRCASLEICKNNVRLNSLIYAQLLQLPTNFTIQLCFLHVRLDQCCVELCKGNVLGGPI